MTITVMMMVVVMVMMMEMPVMVMVVMVMMMMSAQPLSVDCCDAYEGCIHAGIALVFGHEFRPGIEKFSFQVFVCPATEDVTHFTLTGPQMMKKGMKRGGIRNSLAILSLMNHDIQRIWWRVDGLRCCCQCVQLQGQEWYFSPLLRLFLPLLLLLLVFPSLVLPLARETMTSEIRN